MIVLDILGDEDCADFIKPQRTTQVETEQPARLELDPRRVLRKQVINIHGEIVDI